MPQAIWKGHISFGLINIPVVLYSAEDRSDLHFHMVDSRNQARIRYERINEATGEEVPWDSVTKAYEYDDDHHYVLLNDEDFKKADVEASQSVDIESFVDRKSVDCLYFEKPYILVPGKKAEKGYVLLRETLKRTDKIGIAKVVIRTRQYMSALMPRGDALYLNLLRYHQEIRDPSEFDLPKGNVAHYHISKKEIEMAEQLVESISSEWKPEKYKDEYRAKLMKWINEKIRSGDKAGPPKTKEKGETITEGVDLMELLKKSMKQHGNGGSKKVAAAR
jgi:DNA end-binding protein Ku